MKRPLAGGAKWGPEAAPGGAAARRAGRRSAFWRERRGRSCPGSKRVLNERMAGPHKVLAAECDLGVGAGVVG